MENVYKGAKTREISFPLGGIGSGSIGLAGNGRLVDWEIFNRPNKRSFNGFSHFAVKAERNGKLLDARILNGDVQAPYMGEPIRGANLHSGYGFGPESQTMAGMPHFREVAFKGEFPVAEMTFEEPAFPGRVALTAFNPFIPLQEDDSSLPAAFFEWEIENTNDEPTTYMICLSAGNPIPTKKVYHRYSVSEGDRGQAIHMIQLGSAQFADDHVSFGDMTLATDAEEVSYQEFWYRGGWCDNLEMFWHDFARPGRLTNRQYPEDKPPMARKDTASLAAHVELGPGEKKKVRFAISWHFPNVENHWNPNPAGPNGWRNYYATLFEDSAAVANYAFDHWDRLLGDTLKFKEALFSSTVPDVVKDAVSANLSVLKSPTVLRLTDGTFYGFEGCIENIGCCEGSCTHVWNYAYALPFLFPRLERGMRDADFAYNKRADGRMSFRLMLPLGRERMDARACADGQFGGVVKAYRDWKISGDTDWLRSNWPAIKQSITYAWAESNEDKWDPGKTGVLTGRQHHTLDMELYGPNSWLSGFYLAALKAGSEMAAFLGEQSTADEFETIFRKGKQWVDEHLFNGEYYVQRIALSDKLLLDPFGDEAVNSYWNKERDEIKYQIAEGCAIDQVVAQWHANLCGLGEIFDKNQTRRALESLYRHNFKTSMRHEANTWRLYSLNDEGGLVICAWPKGVSKPAIPLTYNTETMTGFEYQAASHMIQEGFVEEGLSIVQAIRDRYDGEKRNPWNEIECGSNYARSMASYSLLQAFSGFEYDMVEGMIGFKPLYTESGSFSVIWSLDMGWGTYGQTDGRIDIHVLGGKLELKAVRLPKERIETIVRIESGDSAAAFFAEGDEIRFVEPVTLNAERPLVIVCA
ncbi:GH116 family glycosyl-hydrolase [Paenibacillus sp. LHD-117]|uniref:GH116 family glycosyl-hydrolase n=1 Tax=Paenibacillus sp. LHD-117 TaxID=3071412 RepID=UPI0027E05070|nr:GH116 family glycosyl-hydrolase [Paenibacillus sp. LHD-117]MDQ6418778.1 GH116 family glycosyl-hydrolase [Paenibacillus sp. LHD-117]